MQKVVTGKKIAGLQVAKAKPTKKQTGKFQAFLAQDKPEIAVNDDKGFRQKKAKNRLETSKDMLNIHIKTTDSQTKKELEQVLQIDSKTFQQLVNGTVSLDDLVKQGKVQISPDLLEGLKELVSSSDHLKKQNILLEIEHDQSEAVEPLQENDNAGKNEKLLKDAAPPLDLKQAKAGPIAEIIADNDVAPQQTEQFGESPAQSVIDLDEMSATQQATLKEQIANFVSMVTSKSAGESQAIQESNSTINLVVSLDTKIKQGAAQQTDLEVESVQPTKIIESPLVSKAGQLGKQEIKTSPEVAAMADELSVSSLKQSAETLSVSSKILIGTKASLAGQKQAAEIIDFSELTDRTGMVSVVEQKSATVTQANVGQKVTTITRPVEQVVRNLQKALTPVVEKSLLSSKGNTQSIVFNLKPANLGEMKVAVKTNEQAVSLEFEVQNSTARDMLQKITHKLEQIMEQLQLDPTSKTLKQVETVRQTAETSELLGEQRDGPAGDFMQNEQEQQRRFARSHKTRTQVVSEEHLPGEEQIKHGTISLLV
ncbi:MAG TPA: flagellar hook-length control protein FliK [Ligilactobacillus acidipiscis]|uniref:Flagellar hook-length control protein FliK n=1 Tax=Ligilactobacillus acidipiscis TaxID=89059 RepID=A0A921F8T8_9LACO|nr:flagellar hook-length control protein FliK [Ligilactobacillus acidipiscis]